MSQRITITLPDEVYQKVKEQAERDFRTIGAEIAYLLHLHVPAYKDITLEPNQITPRSTPTMFTPENPSGQSYSPTNDTYQQPKRTIIG